MIIPKSITCDDNLDLDSRFYIFVLCLYNLIFILKLMSKKKYDQLIYHKCLLIHIFYPHLFLATKVPSIFDEGNFLFVVESREAPQYTVGKRHDKSGRL